MLDYAQWLQRAVAFTDGLHQLPGEVRVEINVATPLSEQEIDDIAQSCRLPIPDPLRRFWSVASGHCHCRYQWTTPKWFHSQLGVAFPNWSKDYIWGGPEFGSPSDMVRMTETGLDFDENFSEPYPRDARFWKDSLPLFDIGNGDHVGFYLRDEVTDPPIVYLCHEGCGGSGIIATSFDDFLTRWEQLGYIGVDFVCSFINRRTGLIDLEAFPVELQSVQTLLRGEVRSDLVKPPLVMTEEEWRTCVEPKIMLEWLESQRKLDRRRVRRFCCACCRRVWDRMGPWSRRAVEVAERFVKGRASRSELDAARRSLAAVNEAPPLLPCDALDWERLLDVSSPRPKDPAWTDFMQHFREGLAASMAFAKSEGIMHYAAHAAVDGDSRVAWEITQHLDEPELTREKMAQADLIRQIFGDKL